MILSVAIKCENNIKKKDKYNFIDELDLVL